MSYPLKMIAFDVDADSLLSVREAFPAGDLEATHGATTRSLGRDWCPAPADLLIVGFQAEEAQALSLCRSLRSQAGRARTPILVLVPAERVDLVRAALAAGADRCLLLPVHPKDLVRMVTRVQVGPRAGRHTLGLDQAALADPWRDNGGES